MKSTKSFFGAAIVVLSIFTGLGLCQFEVCQAIAKEKSNFCSKTSRAAYIACIHEAGDDYWITIG